MTVGRMLLLLERFQISESLAEKCETVGEARPHAEWPGSVVSLVLQQECSAEAKGSTMVIAHAGGVQVAT